MKIHVKTFATFREVMESRFDMEYPQGATIRTLLHDLEKKYDGAGDSIFASPGTLRDFVNILKNGRNVHFINGLDTALDEGDVIALFPPVAGG